MSLKDSFTKEEWFKVMTGPGRAGAAIVASSPSGITGLLAEAQAIAVSIRENVSRQGRTPLMEAIAADLLGQAPKGEELKELMAGQERARNMDEARAQSVEGVRQAVWLVSSKASPADAQAYKDMLMQVVERTAQAAKEGGFLGIGGEQISAKEREAMAELQSVIRGSALPESDTLPEGDSPTDSASSQQ